VIEAAIERRDRDVDVGFGDRTMARFIGPSRLRPVKVQTGCQCIDITRSLR